MGGLRTIFSAIGFCESQQDLERKPVLVEKLATRSLPIADSQDQFKQSMPYEQRLRVALSMMKTKTLDWLVESNIVVCLDQRLSHMNRNILDANVAMAFYRDNGQRILDLRDDGKDPHRLLSGNRSPLFDSAIIALRNQPEKENVLFCTMGMAGKVPVFSWQGLESFKSLMAKNPALREPPLANRPQPAA